MADFYKKTASEIFQVAEEHVTPEQREMAKRATLYLAYAPKAKKVVSLTALHIPQQCGNDPYLLVFALADDGSMWVREKELRHNQESPWTELPKLIQD
jgi:hypothetical protein